MGNKLQTDVVDAVKRQADGQTPIDQFINVKGGGLLADLMKKASKTKNYQDVDDAIREGFRPYLYNDGLGEFIPLRDIIQVRRNGVLAPNSESTDRRSRFGVSNLEAMTDDDTEYGSQSGTKYKEVCWKLDQRGSVGETPLHVCLLNATYIHAELAKRLLRVYPKLVCDFYVNSEYYGENVLHMAIVNEDPAMVKYLLDHGADYHQRCCGNFFTPNDQKASRRDIDDQEWYDVREETNYDGYTYWGEYPLGFAVCLGQAECVRLLQAKGANINLRDTNGNTALHLVIIHYHKMLERKKTFNTYCGPIEMFDLLISLGASINIRNRQGLIPLVLSASLGCTEMYRHILEIDREVYWVYGNVSCAGYPLENIDTISESGKINTKSVLYKVVYGDKMEHLDMFEGAVSHLLDEKWKSFARFRFYRRFIGFFVYFIIFTVAFATRPGADPTAVQSNTTSNASIIASPCYLSQPNSALNDVRFCFESLTVLGSFVYIVLAIKEIYHQSFKIFFQTLNSSPAKFLLLISNIIVILLIPGRAACAYNYENVMCVIAGLCTCPYFLFFCRGFKIVGPFVVMIYTMIRTDLIRFFCIYLIFLIGFSQSMFIIFRGYHKMDAFSTWLESVIGMFRMSLGAFGDLYDDFDEAIMPDTSYVWAPRVVMVLFMILVSVMLINMLIAMMGHTFQLVNESQKEWYRQWAKIVLIIEQTLTTDARRRQQIKYSQPMKDGRRALSIRRDRRGQGSAEEEDLDT